MQCRFLCNNIFWGERRDAMRPWNGEKKRLIGSISIWVTAASGFFPDLTATFRIRQKFDRKAFLLREGNRAHSFCSQNGFFFPATLSDPIFHLANFLEQIYEIALTGGGGCQREREQGGKFDLTNRGTFSREGVSFPASVAFLSFPRSDSRIDISIQKRQKGGQKEKRRISENSDDCATARRFLFRLDERTTNCCFPPSFFCSNSFLCLVTKKEGGNEVDGNSSRGREKRGEATNWRKKPWIRKKNKKNTVQYMDSPNAPNSICFFVWL